MFEFGLALFLVWGLWILYRIFFQEPKNHSRSSRQVSQRSLEQKYALQEQWLQEQDRRFEEAEKAMAEDSKIQKDLAQELIFTEKNKKDLEEKILKTLEIKANVFVFDLKEILEKKMERSRTLECQRWQRAFQEDSEAFLSKKTQKILSQVLGRYQPTFFWPKPSQILEIKENQVENLLSPQSPLSLLTELSETTVRWGKKKESSPVVIPLQFSGGRSFHREAARYALEEYLKKNYSLKILERIFFKKIKELQKKSKKLGKKACRVLELFPMDESLQELIGALHWRTSYRQNQWYHSLEVAYLAGLLAKELRMDVHKARRAGLLHDIGKILDSKEKSHALLGGEYAEKYGEAEDVCDAIASHHEEKIVETSLAYVVRAADTLSGGRPGARVNTDDSYKERLSGILDAVWSFPGVNDVVVMNGLREVHVQVNPKLVREKQVFPMTEAIAKKIQEEVFIPGQIKIVLSRIQEMVVMA